MLAYVIGAAVVAAAYYLFKPSVSVNVPGIGQVGVGTTPTAGPTPTAPQLRVMAPGTAVQVGDVVTVPGDAAEPDRDVSGLPPVDQNAILAVINQQGDNTVFRFRVTEVPAIVGVKPGLAAVRGLMITPVLSTPLTGVFSPTDIKLIERPS